MMMKYIHIIVLMFIASFAMASEKYCFDHLTMDKGLSHNQVNDVYKDEDGFIWFSTAWGLDRYDGYEMKVFLHTQDSTSIPDNYVEWVRDIDDNKMLIYGNREVLVMDKSKEHFMTFESYLRKATKLGKDKLELGWIKDITKAFVDSRKNIWMLCSNVCRVYSCEKGVMAVSELKISSDGVDITSMYDDGNTIMMTDYEGGLYRVILDDDNKIEVVEKIETPAGKGKHRVFCDSSGDCWIVTSSTYGLWYYDVRNKHWEHCQNSDDSYYKVPDFITNGVAEDGTGKIWITSDHGGINIIDKATRKVIEVRSIKNDSRSLMTNCIRNIYYDRCGVMWVGEVRAGISLYNESIFKFNIDDLDMDRIDQGFVGQINTIEEDKRGNLWYGTNGSGLLMVSPDGKKKMFKHKEGDALSLPNDIIVDIVATTSGDMWIGTYIGGLTRFDGQKFENFKSKTNVPPSVSASNIWSVNEDANGNVWVGSLGKGLAKRDKKTGEWTAYDMNNCELKSNYISQIFPVHDGRVLVSTSLGVVVINTQGKVTPIGEGEEGDLIGGNVNDVYVDSRGLVWVGLDAGLAVLDGETYKVKEHFNTSSGLANDVVTSIVEDSDRNMWVTATSGITNIIVNPNPRTSEYTFTIYNYNAQDGFLAGSVNVRSIKRLSTGEILIGGNPGVARFNPIGIKYNRETPPVRFTELSVLGKKVKIGERHEGNVILDKALQYKDRIELPYSDNMFAVSFSVLSHILPSKVTYSYMLEGFNDNWMSDGGHSVTYTNLAPGTYILKVKAANCDGFSNDEISELRITILPPWWKSKMAYGAYALIMALIIWVIMRQVAYKEREKYKLQKIETEIQKKYEMDDMKMSFFTNVSHELRTPLSLIISPIENLMQTSKDEKLKSKLEIMHRNALKLLNIVNQLLDFRKMDVNGMSLNVSEGDIVSFVRTCNESFATLSEKNISFEFSSGIDSLYVKFDKDKIGKVINNLLSNAFKFTPEGGSIKTRVEANEGEIVIKVSDTGIGISDEHKKHIFDKFYQVPQTDSSYSGSGIGLFLVKEFVEMHGGSISVADNKDKGSIFTIVMPLSKVEQQEDEERADNEEVPSSGRMKIVVVDDNADFRTMLVDALIGEYDVVVAKNGEEALEVIIKELPDLIITDVMMPVMDGNELCKRVKNDVRISHIPLIMLTAKSAEEHKIEGLSNGADDYITKPFNLQILQLKVAKLIERGKRNQDTFKRQIEPEPSEITITPLDEQLIRKAIKYVEDNISDSNLSVEEMSRNLGMSRVHLYKKMMSITGRSPIEFIRVIRLKRAAQLLKDKQQNVADVAYSVGFNNPKYFSRYFKEEFGVLPSVYQNNVDGISNDIKIANMSSDE